MSLKVCSIVFGSLHSYFSHRSSVVKNKPVQCSYTLTDVFSLRMGIRIVCRNRYFIILCWGEGCLVE